MASILRSSKFVRYIVGFTRNVAINPLRDIDNRPIQNAPCLCSILKRSLASDLATQHAQNEQSLERSLRRIDQDVRRSGRISRRDIEDILEEIRHTRSASSSQSLLIIRCCGNLVPEEQPEIRTQLVQEIWKTLNKLNVPMDISHYNALLRVYLENEHEFSPIEFLSELDKAGIEPNRVTYQRLIARYCQKGDIDGATKILEFMREKQMPVNENVFNALILGHSQADDMTSARGILSMMQQAGLEPSADTYTTLLCGYARSGDMNEIKKIIETCEKEEINLLDKDYMDVIYALSINGHTEHVPEILSKMKKGFGYNQDCINLILKLLNKNQEDVAMQLLKTMQRGSVDGGEDKAPIGGFFISQLVKMNKSFDTILSTCNYLEKENLNPRALLIATDAAIKNYDLNLSLAFMNEMKTRNLPIRHHYFWPLIISEAKKNGNNGVIQVIKTMISDFGLVISGETLRDYVIPNLKTNTADQCILMLRDAGVSVASSATNLVINYLLKNNIKDGADVAVRYVAHYSPILIKRPLTMAYLRTGDTESYITIVRQVHDNLKRIENIMSSKNEDENEIESSTTGGGDKFDGPHTVGLFVLDAILVSRKNRSEILNDILNGLIEQGLSISSKSAERIQDLIGGDLTPALTSALNKLTSGDLTPIPVIKPSSQRSVMSIPTAIQLEKSIENAETKGENVNGLKRQLLGIYCKNKEVDKVEAFLKNLKGDFEITNGILVQLIDLYANVENLERALHYKQKLDEKDPTFPMDDTKAVKFASLLIKNDRFDEAIDFLQKQSRERKLDERTFSYNNLCWKMLSSLAEAGKTEQVNKLFNTLVEKEYIVPTNVMLGPLIKVHLVNNDLPKAIDEFERCCQQYRMTPWKNELTCKLIQNEDANNLQRLTDLSTSIHGEVNSLYDLVFAFVECGRVRQARKILETPGLRTRQQRVDTICERYSIEGQADPLEGLIEATKDLHHIDRSNIFYHLLNTYIKQDNPEKALSLWTRMQEEDTQPTDQFLTTLGTYLKTKNIKVPFSIPTNVPNTEVQPKKIEKSIAKEEKISDNLKEYRKALKNNELDKALDLQKTINSSQFSIMDHSLLIESLVKTERLNEAKKEVLKMIEENMYPIPRVFRFFLNKLALAGDVDTLNTIGDHLKPELKKIVSFDNRLCHANIVAGKSTEFLTSLEKVIDNVQDDQIAEIASSFPRGGAMGILESNPELLPRFEKIAFKYADKGIIAPVNVLWMKHLISKNDEAAQQIWNKYLKNSPRIMFQRVVQYARDSKDDRIARKLIETIKSTKVSEGALGNAYSCLLDVLVAKEQFDEGLKELQQAVKDVCLENINRTALVRLQEGLSKAGKKFPYEIPSKKLKSSTSSSSSSDDEKKK